MLKPRAELFDPLDHGRGRYEIGPGIVRIDDRSVLAVVHRDKSFVKVRFCRVTTIFSYNSSHSGGNVLIDRAITARRKRFCKGSYDIRDLMSSILQKYCEIVYQNGYIDSKKEITLPPRVRERPRRGRNDPITSPRLQIGGFRRSSRNQRLETYNLSFRNT